MNDMNIKHNKRKFAEFADEEEIELYDIYMRKHTDLMLDTFGNDTVIWLVQQFVIGNPKPLGDTNSELYVGMHTGVVIPLKQFAKDLGMDDRAIDNAKVYMKRAGCAIVM